MEKQIPAHEQLEKELAEWSGCPQVVCCSSGTAALHLALESLSLTPQAAVVVPDFTMIACPRAVVMADLRPVFIDCDDLMLLDPKVMEQYFSVARLKPGQRHEGSVQAIMAVHVYGRRCNMDRLAELADKHKLYLIEDLAEAHGITPHERTDAAVHSFYKNKIVAGEEGGAIGFRDPALAAKARQLRSLGFTDAHDFRHVPRGHNYRLADSLAKQISDSLRKIGDNLIQRRRIEGWYEEACPIDWRLPTRDVVWVYDLRIRGLRNGHRGDIVRTLNDEGIAARHAFQPMSRQDEFCGKVSCALKNLDEHKAERMANEVIYLPVQPGLTTKADTVRAFSLINRVLH